MGTKLILITLLLGLSACATASDNSANKDGINNTKYYASIERLKCPKSRYRSVKKRLECKHKVREEMNEQNSKAN